MTASSDLDAACLCVYLLLFSHKYLFLLYLSPFSSVISFLFPILTFVIAVIRNPKCIDFNLYEYSNIGGIVLCGVSERFHR